MKSESSMEKERESREKRKGNANEGWTNEEKDRIRWEKRWMERAKSTRNGTEGVDEKRG